MTAFSVLVISHQRDGHLANLVAGINRSTLLPAELIITYMDQSDPAPLDSVVPVRTIHCPAADGNLPLAAARNAAARAASTENLIFLDVDCIPSRSMFSILMADLLQAGGLVMAQPRYLRPGARIVADDGEARGAYGDSTDDDEADDDGGADDASLERESVPHHSRTGLAPAAGEPPSSTDRYELFWSLGFAVKAADFGRLGGFDEVYTGYGGEDTDFAFTARAKSVALSFSSALMFHQHHGVIHPPLQHLAAIVRNGGVFRRKWGCWPMTGWLKAFADAGYISWSPEDSRLEVLRLPSMQDIAAATVDAPY